MRPHTKGFGEGWAGTAEGLRKAGAVIIGDSLHLIQPATESLSARWSDRTVAVLGSILK